MNNKGITNVGDVMKYIGEIDSYIENEFEKLEEYANNKNYSQCLICVSKLKDFKQEIMDLKLMEVKK